MNYIILIVAIACFAYGAWGLFTSKLFEIDVKAISERHKKLYSKLCGVLLLFESAILGIGLYLKETEQLNSPFLISFLVVIPIIVLSVLRKIFKKK